ETLSGGPDVPYGGHLRLGSGDPSFVEVGKQHKRSYLLGALRTNGLFGSQWETDAVMYNPSAAAIAVDVTFTATGATPQPTAPYHVLIQPGQTLRLADVLSNWDLTGAVGLLTFDATSATGDFPIVQGETSEVSNPALVYGQFMPALSDGAVA